jgi:ribose transport system permease protein
MTPKVASSENDRRTDISIAEVAPARKSALAPEWLLLGAILVIMAVFTVQAPVFLSQTNLVDTAQSSTEVGLLAVGELFVIITAGIDLSVGATLGLSGVLGALAVGDIKSVFLGLLVAVAATLATGIAVGLFNGIVITRLGLSPFIATLASLGIVTGATLIVSNGQDELGVTTGLEAFGQNVVFGWLTWPIILTLALGGCAGLVLHLGVFGHWTYAVGSNRTAARESGINVRRHLIKVYVLSSVFASISGFVLMARLGDGSPLSGQNDELSAITAVVIGGASLFGGRGNMVGTLMGIWLLSIILDGLIIVGVQPYWQTVATGLLLVAAVTAQNVTRRGIKREGGT